MNPIFISSNNNNCNIIEVYIMFLCDLMSTLEYFWLESKIYFEKVLVTTNNTLMWAISFIVKNFMAPFYGRGSTDSRLEPLRGGFRGGKSGHAASLFFAIALKNYKLCSLKLIMNNVPLTYVYLSATKTCLTPNHLLFGRQLLYCSNTALTVLVLILSTLKGWNAKSTLEPPCGFEQGTHELGIQCLNPVP